MRRADKEKLHRLRGKARRRGLSVVSNGVKSELALDYGMVAVRRGKYGPPIHPLGEHSMYSLSLNQAEALIEGYDPIA